MSFIKFWKKEVMLPHPVLNVIYQWHVSLVNYLFNEINVWYLLTHECRLCCISSTFWNSKRNQRTIKRVSFCSYRWCEDAPPREYSGRQTNNMRTRSLYRGLERRRRSCRRRMPPDGVARRRKGMNRWTTRNNPDRQRRPWQSIPLHPACALRPLCTVFATARVVLRLHLGPRTPPSRGCFRPIGTPQKHRSRENRPRSSKCRTSPPARCAASRSIFTTNNVMRC